MIVFPNSLTWQTKQNNRKIEQQRLYKAYLRFFNVKPNPAGTAKIDDSPVMRLMLNHFYDSEIIQPYTFNEIELKDRITQSFFNNITLINLP